MIIKVLSKGKGFFEYYLTLYFNNDKYKYKETFFGNYQIINKYYYKLKTKDIKKQLKLYNKLKKLTRYISKRI